MFQLKIIWVSVFFVSLVQAQSLSDIQDLYKVHQQMVETKDDEVIYSRTKAGEGRLSVFGKAVQSDFGVAEGEIETATTTSLDFVSLAENVASESDFEAQTRAWENQMLFRMQIRPLFINERVEDSVFDLVQDLNDIDQVLFGTKSEPLLEPPFARPDSVDFEEAIHELSQIGDKEQEVVEEGLSLIHI